MGLTYEDPYAAELAGKIAFCSLAMSVLSLIALIIQMSLGFYFGAGLFASCIIPLLGLCGARARSRCLLFTFATANAIMLVVFFSITVPFLIWIVAQSHYPIPWAVGTTAFCILMACLQLAGCVYGCAAANNPAFHPAPEEVYACGPPAVMVVLPAGPPPPPHYYGAAVPLNAGKL